MALRNSFYGGMQQQFPAPGGMAPSPVLYQGANPAEIQQAPLQAAPEYRLGGLITYETPIREFPADIVVTGPADVILRAGNELPYNCVGARFISVLGTVAVSINGGGARTLLNNDTISGAELKSIELFVSVGGSAIVQVVGTGD